MGRSAKEECRPDQVVDGGGKVNTGAMGVGIMVRPTDTKAGVQGKDQMASRPSGQSENQHVRLGTADEEEEKGGGWDAIGQAGAGMVTEAKQRRAAKSKSKSKSKKSKGSMSF